MIKLDESYKVLPVDEFNTIDVIPGEKDLKEAKSKDEIRGMPQSGDLINSHNYLDLLFRLLHEDAISDLRQGVIMMSHLDSQKLSKRELRNKVRATQIKLHE
jgi:hypothetical protein